jgi:hypothetical protein
VLRLRRAGLLRIPVPRPPRAEHDCTRIVFGLVGTAKRERKKANRTARQYLGGSLGLTASASAEGNISGALPSRTSVPQALTMTDQQHR